MKKLSYVTLLYSFEYMFSKDRIRKFLQSNNQGYEHFYIRKLEKL